MRKIILLAAAMTALSIGAAHAAQVTDPVGDLAPGFTDAANADLDVTKFAVHYDATAQNFTFIGTMAGALNAANGNVYVIGVDNAPGAHNPFKQAPGVFFNSVISVGENGVATIAGHPNLMADISGSTFSLVVPLSDISSTTFSPQQYGFNLWPETATRAISDFAPNNSLIGAVPEPASWAMMIMGFGIVGFAMRRSSRPQSQTAAI